MDKVMQKIQIYPWFVAPRVYIKINKYFHLIAMHVVNLSCLNFFTLIIGQRKTDIHNLICLFIILSIMVYIDTGIMMIFKLCDLKKYTF